jgi:hypothetical protein
MKEFFLKNILAKFPPKMRVKMVEIFGKYYWMEMSDEEFMSKWDSIFTIDTGIHNKQQLEKKVVELVDTTDLDLFNNVPYRFISYHDYDDDCSYILWLGSHAWIDGVHILAFIVFMSDQ